MSHWGGAKQNRHVKLNNHLNARKGSHNMVTVMENIVKFRFLSPDASNVEIVGDFTGWRCGQIHMTKTDGGFWTAQLPLTEGIFHFRYLADGEWHTDETASRVDDGPFGVDSVLWVLPQSLTHTQPRQAKTRMLRMADARIGSPGPQTFDMQDRFSANRTATSRLPKPRRQMACSAASGAGL